MDRTEPGLKSSTLIVLSTLLGFMVGLLFTYSAFFPGEENETLPGVAALLICVLFLLFQFRGIAEEDRHWLVRLTTFAFLLRVAVSLAIFYGPLNRDLLGEDQVGYDHMPRLIVRYWIGDGSRPDRLLDQTNRLGYYYFVAIQYYFLGWSLLIPRMFNCLGGALMVLYAYRLGIAVYDRAVARVVASWVGVFPSLVLWSSLNMRDVWLALTILIIVYHTLQLRDRFSILSLLPIFLGLLWLNFNRFYLVGVMGLVVVCILAMGRFRHMIRNLFLLFVVLAGMVMLHIVLGLGEKAIDYADMTTIAQYRQKLGGKYTGNSGYLTELDATNPLVLVILIPLGLVYFLFSPFPWQIRGMRQILTLPEMVVWYLAVPFVAQAVARALRAREPRELGLLTALTWITVAYCIGSVNMGAAYRYRAQIIVFYLLFGAAGLVRKKRRSMPGRGWGQGGQLPVFQFEPLTIAGRAAGRGIDGPPVSPSSPGGVTP
jgi:hypothetical protein